MQVEEKSSGETSVPLQQTVERRIREETDFLREV
jgi:hypothetical protein